MTSSTSPAGLFSQLSPLLAHRTVLITVSQIENGDRLQVNICPRQLKDGENPALTTPLSVSGTAAELDAELIPQITTFVALQVGLHSNLTVIQQELAEAEKNAREEAKKKQKTVGHGGTKAVEAPARVQPDKTPSEPPAAPMLSLFDEALPITVVNPLTPGA